MQGERRGGMPVLVHCDNGATQRRRYRFCLKGAATLDCGPGYRT
jgi:hypothetical protein